MIAKHTPMPWFIEADLVYAMNRAGTNRFCAQFQGGNQSDNRREFEATSGAEVLANARFVHTAVNTHDELVAALESILANITYEHGGGRENCRFCDADMDHEGTFADMHTKDCEVHKIRAALAKAKGEHPTDRM